MDVKLAVEFVKQSFRYSVRSSSFDLGGPFAGLEDHSALFNIQNGWSFDGHDILVRISTDDQFVTESMSLSNRIEMSRVNQIECSVNVTSLDGLGDRNFRAIYHVL